MQIRNSRSTSGDDLLGCRMAMLGLDLSAIESSGGEVFKTIKQRCTSCDWREACELDLRRDPNDPLWETYSDAHCAPRGLVARGQIGRPVRKFGVRHLLLVPAFAPSQT